MTDIDDGPDAVLADLRFITEKAQQQENLQAALKAIELRGKHFGLWQNKQGSDLASSEEIVQRYKAARERARQSAEAHAVENVVRLRSK